MGLPASASCSCGSRLTSASTRYSPSRCRPPRLPDMGSGWLSAANGADYAYAYSINTLANTRTHGVASISQLQLQLPTTSASLVLSILRCRPPHRRRYGIWIGLKVLSDVTDYVCIHPAPAANTRTHGVCQHQLAAAAAPRLFICITNLLSHHDAVLRGCRVCVWIGPESTLNGTDYIYMQHQHLQRTPTRTHGVANIN
jgi:hypothetical protein